MLGETNIVAFVPTKDAEKARAFYEGVLGLRFVSRAGTRRRGSRIPTEIYRQFHSMFEGN